MDAEEIGVSMNDGKFASCWNFMWYDFSGFAIKRAMESQKQALQIQLALHS